MKHGRQFTDAQREAGYHEQDWGPPPTAGHEMIGTYEGVGPDGKPVFIEVTHLPEGPSGVAEFEIQFGPPDGAKVTVLNDEVVAAYLVLYGVPLA